MVPPQVLVTLHLPPGDAERGDHRSRVRLVLVRQQQGVAAVIEAPAVTAGRREHAYSPPCYRRGSVTETVFENCSAAVRRNFNARLGTRRRRCRPRAYLAEPGHPGRGIAARRRPAFETALTTPKELTAELSAHVPSSRQHPGPLSAPTYRPGDGPDDARGTAREVRGPMKDVAVVAYCRTGIARATQGALNQTHGMKYHQLAMSDVDLWELHEAYAGPRSTTRRSSRHRGRSRT